MQPYALTFEQLCTLFNYLPKNRPLTTDDLVALTGLARNTWEQHRLRGTGPRYFQPSGTRRVWYSERDFLVWMASGARHSTSHPPGEALNV